MYHAGVAQGEVAEGVAQAPLHWCVSGSGAGSVMCVVVMCVVGGLVTCHRSTPISGVCVAARGLAEIWWQRGETLAPHPRRGAAQPGLPALATPPRATRFRTHRRAFPTADAPCASCDPPPSPRRGPPRNRDSTSRRELAVVDQRVGATSATTRCADRDDAVTARLVPGENGRGLVDRSTSKVCDIGSETAFLDHTYPPGGGEYSRSHRAARSRYLMIPL